MGGAFENLIRNTNALVVSPVIDGYLVPLQLHEIYIRGLRERDLHNSNAAFVEVSVIGVDGVVLRTSVSSASTSPSWPLEKPVRLAVTPSSIIRFKVFRHHHIRPDQPIAEVEGTAWTFLNNDWIAPKSESKDSPHMILSAVMRIADAEHPNDDQNKAEYRLGCERDRLDDINAQYRGKADQWKRLQETLLEALKYLLSICKTLEDMAEGIPLCKAASVFLRAIVTGLEHMIETRKQIDSEIMQLIQSLHEAVVEASRGASDAKHEAAKIAGECAELFDKWVCTSLGVQFFKATAGSVHSHVHQCHERVSSFKSKLREKMRHQSSPYDSSCVDGMHGGRCKPAIRSFGTNGQISESIA